MKKQTYLLVSGLVFGIVAIVHLIRALMGSSFVIIGWTVPIWLSWVAVLFAGFLSYSSFRLRSSRKG